VAMLVSIQHQRTFLSLGLESSWSVKQICLALECKAALSHDGVSSNALSLSLESKATIFSSVTPKVTLSFGV